MIVGNVVFASSPLFAERYERARSRERHQPAAQTPEQMFEIAKALTLRLGGTIVTKAKES